MRNRREKDAMRHHQPTLKERRKSLAGVARARGHVIRKAIGDVISTKRRAREEQVLTALTRHDEISFPSWFQSAESASGKDEARGIDVTVHSDVGKLFLQVKGSPKAVQEFLKKHPKGNIVPFLVHDDEHIDGLRKRLVEALSAERRRVLDLRKR